MMTERISVVILLSALDRFPFVGEIRRNKVSEVQVAYHPFLQPAKTAPAITGCNMPWLLNLSCGCCHDNVMFVWIIPAWVKLSGSWLAPGLMIPRPSSRSSQSVSLLWLGGPRSHSRYLNYLPWLGSSKTGGGVTLLRGRHILLGVYALPSSVCFHDTLKGVRWGPVC